MPICTITVSSNNKQSLFNFLFFLFKKSKLNFICKFVEKKNKKKVVTVLKSPHVNKKAQEQFEIRNFSKQCKLLFYDSPKFLVTLKKIKVKLFPDVSLKINLFINSKGSLRNKIRVFNINRYRLIVNGFGTFSQELNSSSSLKNKKKQEYYYSFKKKLIRKTKNYLKVFDCYGELNLNSLV